MTLRKGENVPLPTAVLRVEFSRRAGAGIPRSKYARRPAVATHP
ncbi:hypothetical protein ABZ901_33830 [Actinacidiphila alni]